MTVTLGDHLFRDVQLSPIEFQYRGRDLRLIANGPDRIQIVENDAILAFLTRYSESESGILRAGSPMKILAPLYRTLDEALNSLRLD
jgi:hypothetical protein